VSFNFVGTYVKHKPSISDNLAFGHCLEWDEKYCVGSFNSSSNTLGQASKFICCCFVTDGKSSLILYEVAVLQAGASVLIDDRSGHGNRIRGLFWGYIKTLLICECNGAENGWGKKLGLIGRVLACPGSSVVPGDGWSFDVFFFKSGKQIHTCHALRHIGDIFCGLARSEVKDTSDWQCISHPRRGYILLIVCSFRNL
jgi:hypothetical protein